MISFIWKKPLDILENRLVSNGVEGAKKPFMKMKF